MQKRTVPATLRGLKPSRGAGGTQADGDTGIAPGSSPDTERDAEQMAHPDQFVQFGHGTAGFPAGHRLTGDIQPVGQIPLRQISFAAKTIDGLTNAHTQPLLYGFSGFIIRPGREKVYQAAL